MLVDHLLLRLHVLDGWGARPLTMLLSFLLGVVPLLLDVLSGTLDQVLLLPKADMVCQQILLYQLVILVLPTLLVLTQQLAHEQILLVKI